MSEEPFRWSSLGPDTPQLFKSQRIVGSGAYKSLVFHEVESKSLINKVSSNSHVPFDYTINVYRGCSHACVYCFARPTHEYLGFNLGNDFDKQIVVKTNAVELADAETSPSRWAGHRIAMGTNTDPYQKAEGKYRLTRGVVEVLTRRRNPFSILTKSTLALRDLDLFVEAAKQTSMSVDFSIATLDEDVWRETEPGTPHPRQRLKAVHRLNAAGVPSGVLVAPLLPRLSDAEAQVEEVTRAAAEAGAQFVSPMMLYLTPPMKAHWSAWLQTHHPELMSTYTELYRSRTRLQPVRIQSSRERWARRSPQGSVPSGEQLALWG